MTRWCRLAGRVALPVLVLAATLTVPKQAATAAVANCLGNKNRVLSANYVVSNWGQRLGAVQLCKDVDDRFAFVLLIMYAPMPAGRWGNAALDIRFPDGEIFTYTCDSTWAGGTGHITPGGTWCKSGNVITCDNPAGCEPRYQHIRGRGYVYERNHYGDWEAVARGVTAWIAR